MLQLTIPGQELFDEKKNEFIQTKEQRLTIEHSLVSLSKWEAKWCKPFLSDKEKTRAETIDYVKCMTLTQNVPEEAYQRLTAENFKQIDAYIEAPMTATWFSGSEKKGRRGSEQITAELIYYWMISLNIPFECQKWHLNRLLTLIRVCSVKNALWYELRKNRWMLRN